MNHPFKLCNFCDFQGLVSESPVESQEEEKDRIFSLGAPSAKRLKTQFRCSKCGFLTDDSTQFQQHIPQHRTDENTPQCRHCGLCFTSVLSLNRHLFIVHKVREEEREEEEEAAEVGKIKQDNQLVRPADTDLVNDLLSELNEPEISQAERCDKSADWNFKLSTNSQTQAVSLR